MTILTPQGAIAVRQVDLRQPLRALTDVTPYHGVCLFVMWDDCPLGSVDIANHHQPISVARLREAIVDKLALKLLKPILAQHYTPTGDGAAVALPPRLSADIPVSVVVATYDRPDELRTCLRCLMAQRSPRPVEIIVVDNHPASGLTPPVVVAFPDVVLVSEPRQGLAYARNTGFVVSQGDIVATTDDDVTTPPDWLEKLLAPFVRPDVLAVTSNILPLELETTAQCLFEAYGGLGRGFDVRVADRDWFARFGSAVPTWELGATANAAFRAAIFSDPQIGLMDEALGPGMPAGVGEDTYLFYKILKAGHTIVYEPSAYVWHKHRHELTALRRQLYAYSKGHVAYHLTTLLRDHDLRALVYLMLQLPWLYAVRLRERLRGTTVYPVSLLLLEIAGNLVGPWALWRSRRRVKREGRSGPYIPVCQRSAAALRPALLEANSVPGATLQGMSGGS